MAAKLSTAANRVVVIVVVVAVVLVAGWYFLIRGDDTKSVTARFDAAVGVYVGTPVRILGVTVGKVTSVKPHATYVAVSMTYDDKYKVPSNAGAFEVANSLVSDRYVQLDPAWGDPGATATEMADNATIPTEPTSKSRGTGGPAELDQIYGALNKLAVALGPEGANKGGKQNGALSNLLNVAAANLSGNGTPLGNSITQLAQAAKTLSDNRGNIFATVQNLQKFTKTLSDNDAQVRQFNTLLDKVAGDFAGERTDLGAALHDLTLTLDNVSKFINDNSSAFHGATVGLRKATDTLVHEKASLNETLSIAPTALANIIHAYQPNLGTIASRGNLTTLTDPTQLCGLIYTALNLGGDNTGNLLGTITNTINTACTNLLSTAAGGVNQILGFLAKLFPGINDPSSIAGTLADIFKGIGIGGLLGVG